jgi:hypothetical protein
VRVSKRRKLTADQVKWARELAAKRADLKRQIALLPTMAQAAAQLGVSLSCLKNLFTNRTYRG